MSKKGISLRRKLLHRRKKCFTLAAILKLNYLRTIYYLDTKPKIPSMTGFSLFWLSRCRLARG